MTAIDELEVAIEAAQSAGGGLPVFASMSFDKGGAGFRTMMGVEVATAVAKMIALRRGRRRFQLRHHHARRVRGTVEDLRRRGGQGKGPGLRANPTPASRNWSDGQAVYKVTPEEFAAACRRILDAGIHILGGCCGSTPQHIGAVAQALKH